VQTHCLTESSRDAYPFIRNQRRHCPYRDLRRLKSPDARRAVRRRGPPIERRVTLSDSAGRIKRAAAGQTDHTRAHPARGAFASQFGFASRKSVPSRFELTLLRHSDGFRWPVRAAIARKALDATHPKRTHLGVSGARSRDLSAFSRARARTIGHLHTSSCRNSVNSLDGTRRRAGTLFGTWSRRSDKLLRKRSAHAGCARVWADPAPYGAAIAAPPGRRNPALRPLAVSLSATVRCSVGVDHGQRARDRVDGVATRSRVKATDRSDVAAREGSGLASAGAPTRWISRVGREPSLHRAAIAAPPGRRNPASRRNTVNS
jgi:hypothetical protein